jgi:hypothetical protein
MNGEEKEGLLNQEERERMINRGQYDRGSVSENDLKIKRKLRAWLNAINDVHQILRYLPEDLVRDELIDEHAFDLLSTATDIMRLQKFLSVFGNLENPDGWQARGYGIIQLAEDKDIARSLILNSHLRALSVFAGESYIETKNPTNKAKMLARYQDDPIFLREIKPEEDRAINRIKRARINYSRLHSLEPLDFTKNLLLI